MTITLEPSGKVAACACAIDAAATGSQSNDANTVSTGAPSSCSSSALTASGAAGGAPACSLASSVVTSDGSKSVRVDATWPSLTNIPPHSSIA